MIIANLLARVGDSGMIAMQKAKGKRQKAKGKMQNAKGKMRNDTHHASRIAHHGGEELWQRAC
jgi:hypothetical protein